MNKNNLKPIETKYKGYKFRSRLEARWAVFFEGMGLDWTYEPEGFELPSGAWYLPDFFVKGHITGKDYYYEIKPRGSKPCLKVEEFNNIKSIFQLNGDPVDVVNILCPRCKLICLNNPGEKQSTYLFLYGKRDGRLDGRLDTNEPVFYYYCEYCDSSKSEGGSFTENNAFNYMGDKINLHWHEGEMEFNYNEDSWFADFEYDIEFWKLKARQERFDGNDNII